MLSCLDQPLTEMDGDATSSLTNQQCEWRATARHDISVKETGRKAKLNCTMTGKRHDAQKQLKLHIVAEVASGKGPV